MNDTDNDTNPLSLHNVCYAINFKNSYEKSMAPEGVLTIKNRSNMN